MANIKITELTELTTVADPTLLIIPVVNNGTATQKITLANLNAASAGTRFRDGYVPNNSIGANGDKKGDLAMTTAFLYYCVTDFVGFPTKCWQRIAKDATNW